MRTLSSGALTRAGRAAPRALLILALSAAPGRAQQVAEIPDPPILPGDVIRLKVWREPDWNGDFLVDQFSVAALPLVGDIDVTGLTQRSLKERLREAFARELHDPSFQVLILKRIRIIGEVRSPGVYPLDPTMSVADALAVAGGRSGTGRSDMVFLRRAGETLATSVLVDARLAELAIQTGDELRVPERSWAGRNASALIGSLAGVLGLAAAILLR